MSTKSHRKFRYTYVSVRRSNMRSGNIVKKSARNKSIIRLYQSVLAGLLLLPASLAAQFYAGAGYSQGLIFPDQLDFIVNEYNSRGYLFNVLDKIRFPGGEKLIVGYDLGELRFEAGWTGRRQRSSAKNPSLDGTYVERRDLRVMMNHFNIGTGFNFPTEGNTRFTVGGSFDAGWVRVQTRLGNELHLNNTRYSDLIQQASFAVTFYGEVNFKNEAGTAGFRIRPYYQHNFNTYEMIFVLYQLNGAGLYREGPYNLLERMHNFGLELLISLEKFKFNQSGR